MSNSFRMLLVIWIMCLCLVPRAQAQQQYNNWFFGAHAGLSFNTTPLTVVSNGQQDALDGTTVMSDPETGNLLFYSDGNSIWNANHEIMSNGTNLKGHPSSGQAALAIPDPGNKKKYYLFTSGSIHESKRQIFYSIIDMTMDGGKGAIIEKNVLLIEDGTEKLTATRHCNGVDYWVLSYEGSKNMFLAFQISSDGISSPVQSKSAIEYFADQAVQGILQISPNGQRVAITNALPMTVELCEFNNATGVVVNHHVFISGENYYGIEFSPDNSKLYVQLLPEPGTPASLYQFDLDAGSEDAIRRSRKELDAITGSWEGGQIQMGPDGKIYVSWFKKKYLAAIENPNEAAPACNYIRDAVYLGGALVLYGLPNLVDSDMPGVVVDRSSICDHSIDYTYHFFPGCVGKTDEVNVLFGYAKPLLDTVVGITFEGEGKENYSYNGRLPVQIPLGGQSDQWIPLLYQRTHPGQKSSTMVLSTTSGENIYLRLITEVAGTSSSIFDISHIGLPPRDVDYDTCITVRNIQREKVLLIHTAWLGESDREIEAVISELPRVLDPEQSFTMCFSVSKAYSGDSDTLMLVSPAVSDLCRSCQFHRIEINGKISQSKDTDLTEIELASGTDARIVPNPVSDGTTLILELPRLFAVRVRIFNSDGLTVKLVLTEKLQLGIHEVPISTNDLPSGSYFIHVELNSGEDQALFPLKVLH